MKRKAIQKLIEFEDFSGNDDYEDYDDGQDKRRRRPLGGDSEEEDANDVSR